MAIGNGLPVVGDMCMGSALHANGTPYPDAATVDGKAIDRLTTQKHDNYPALLLFLFLVSRSVVLPSSVAASSCGVPFAWIALLLVGGSLDLALCVA